MTFDQAAEELAKLAGRHIHLAATSPAGEKLFEMRDAVDAVRLRSDLIYVTLASIESVIIVRRVGFVDAAWQVQDDPAPERTLHIQLAPITWEFTLAVDAQA